MLLSNAVSESRTMLKFDMSVKLAAQRPSGLAASIELARSFYDQFRQTGALLIAVNQI